MALTPDPEKEIKCRCGRPLWHRDELLYKRCYTCLEAMAERERERREFEYYHRDEE